MKQLSLASVPAFERRSKPTRKRGVFGRDAASSPGLKLVALIEPYAPKPGPKGGRPPFSVETLLRIYCLEQWFNLSDRGGILRGPCRPAGGMKCHAGVDAESGLIHTVAATAAHVACDASAPAVAGGLRPMSGPMRGIRDGEYPSALFLI